MNFTFRSVYTVLRRGELPSDRSIILSVRSSEIRKFGHRPLFSPLFLRHIDPRIYYSPIICRYLDSSAEFGCAREFPVKIASDESRRADSRRETTRANLVSFAVGERRTTNVRFRSRTLHAGGTILSYFTRPRRRHRERTHAGNTRPSTAKHRVLFANRPLEFSARAVMLILC